MKEDNTCYIDRTKVRNILITSNTDNETTRELLAEVDALPIFVASDFTAAAQAPKEPIAFIAARLTDLAEANALYGKDQRLGAPDKVARNDREISWLKDLRSLILTSSTVPSASREGGK